MRFTRSCHMRRLFLLLLAVLIPVSAVLFAQEKGGENETGPYELVPNWPQLSTVCPAGHTWGSTGGIFAQSPDRVFIFQRGCLPELKGSGRGAADSFIPERNASRRATRAGSASSTSSTKRRS